MTGPDDAAAAGLIVTASTKTSDAGFTAHKWLWSLALCVVQTALYYGIGYAPLARSTELLRTPLDDAIPFWPATVWLYAPVYPAILLCGIAGFRSRATFNRALVGMLFIMGAALAGHLLVGATYPRPLLHAPFPTASEAFMAGVQGTDPPTNVFPSLHVADSAGVALLVARDRPRLGRWLLAVSLLLALSTLTTKQHFVADVLAGLALAATVAWLVRRAPLVA